VIETGETCEGSDFGGATCEDFGFSGGSLICNTYCNIVVSSCTPKELCTDNQDNDGDFLVDCADPECIAEVACTDPCAFPQFVSVPAWGWGEIGGEPSVLAPGCTATSGREAVYQVTAAVTGDLTVTFYPGAFDGVIYIRTDCDDPSTEIACVNNSGSAQTENASIPATAGQTYFVIVESTSPTATGYYNVSIDQPLPESYCWDGYDDDFDGYLDCDDPTNCQGISFDCTPGTEPYAEPCSANTECFATGNDPICLDYSWGFSNGYCSEFCATGADCTNGGVCMDLNISVHGVCFKPCQVTNDCPSGLACVDVGGGTKVCDKPPEINCQDNQDNDSDGFRDCEDPTSCKGQSFSCTSGPTAVGGACQVHNECATIDGDPICLDQFWWGWPGGYCSEFCDMALDDCAAGSVCSDWFFFPSGNGICLDECVQQSDCRPGYSCTNIGGNNVCIY
jgi:hypothetical protein